MESLEAIDRWIVLSINGFNSPFFDTFFWIISKTITWLPWYAIILYCVYKKDKWNGLFNFLILSLITITAVDLSCTHFFKDVFQRFRPSHNLLLENKLHLYLLDDDSFYKGGRFGFISSHAANHFAVATLLFLNLKENNTIVYLGVFFAFLISYSRIYLGVHYLSDLFCGAIWGILVAFLFWKIFHRIKITFQK